MKQSKYGSILIAENCNFSDQPKYACLFAFQNYPLLGIIIQYWISLRRIQGNIGRDVTILDESKMSPILSHRVPIFPYILRKREIQYYHYYLDHHCEIMNFLYEQKIS